MSSSALEERQQWKVAAAVYVHTPSEHNKILIHFSFTVATDLVWIDLCPVPPIEILIFNYQKCFQNGSDIIR
jgi:hypothetical protein